MAIIKRLFTTPKESVDTHPDRSSDISSNGGRSKKRGNDKRPDLYQEVTDNLVTAIENGTAPWQRPWDGKIRWPLNPTTKKPYHGINVLLLAGESYQDPRWCSYRQAKEQGWQVNKGEQGSRIYFYKLLQREGNEIDPSTGELEMQNIPVLKNYTVFNLSQMENTPKLEWETGYTKKISNLTEQICQDIVESTGADISYGRRHAAYSPSQDRIYMPVKASFESDGDYYATLLHELAHWSGHESRLKREFGSDRKSEAYAREELRAEMASAMLSMRLGIPSMIDGHASYVDHYLQILRKDKKEIFRAAKDAEKIARYVLGFHPDFRDELESEHRDQIQSVLDSGAPEEMFDASEFDFEPDIGPQASMRM